MDVEENFWRESEERLPIGGTELTCRGFCSTAAARQFFFSPSYSIFNHDVHFFDHDSAIKSGSVGRFSFSQEQVERFTR